MRPRFSSPLASFLSLACALLGPACVTPGAGPDGGLSEGGGPPAGLIVIESEESLSLTYGQSAEIRARYLDADGEPGAGVQLVFALQGRAHDSGLETLSTTTGEDGRVSSVLFAGTTSAAFRLRVSSARAAPVYIDVAVDDAGFGALRVELPYEGERPVGPRRLDLFAARSCEQPDLPTTGDRSVTLRTGVEAYTFASLPVSATYALRAVGLGASGEVLASACVDRLEVAPEETTTAAVPLLDLPLLYEGEYTLRIALRPAATAGRAAAAVASAVGGASAVGDGAVLLDALGEELAALGASAAAASLDTERAGGLDALLDARLGAASMGASLAAAALDRELRAALAELGAEAELRWSSSAATLAVVGGSVAGEGAPLPIAAAAFGESREPAILLSYEEGDLVRLEDLSISATLGALSLAAIDARAEERALIAPGAGGGGGAIVRAEIGCAELGALVEERSELSSACDAACLASACGRAVALLWGAAETALLELDGQRSQLHLRGELSAVDEIGDLRLDRFDGEGLTGTWGGFLSTEMDPLEADLMATRREGSAPAP